MIVTNTSDRIVTLTQDSNMYCILTRNLAKTERVTGMWLNTHVWLTKKELAAIVAAYNLKEAHASQD